MKLFTIGYKDKGVEDFFYMLSCNKIRRVIDIRGKRDYLNEDFTKPEDFKFLLNRLEGMDYIHMPELSLDDEIRIYCRQGILDYKKAYTELLDGTNIFNNLDLSLFDYGCLMCKGLYTQNSDREMVAEYLKGKIPDLEVIHL